MSDWWQSAVAQLIIAGGLWALWSAIREFVREFRPPTVDQRQPELGPALTPAEQAERENAEWWRQVGGMPR